MCNCGGGGRPRLTRTQRIARRQRRIARRQRIMRQIQIRQKKIQMRKAKKLAQQKALKEKAQQTAK